MLMSILNSSFMAGNRSLGISLWKRLRKTCSSISRYTLRRRFM